MISINKWYQTETTGNLFCPKQDCIHSTSSIVVMDKNIIKAASSLPSQFLFNSAWRNCFPYSCFILSHQNTNLIHHGNHATCSFNLTQWLEIILHMIRSYYRCCCINEPVISVTVFILSQDTDSMPCWKLIPCSDRDDTYPFKCTRYTLGSIATFWLILTLAVGGGFQGFKISSTIYKFILIYLFLLHTPNFSLLCHRTVLCCQQYSL